MALISPRPDRLFVALLWLAIATGTCVADEHAPELDVAIAAAHTAHQALIVEFSTTWCGPCRTLAEKVLPDPLVAAALSQVKFVQYDAERGAGIKAAKRFEVSSYPTLVAVSDGGAALDRMVGLHDAVELAAWVQKAADGARPSLSSLVDEAKQRPNDAGLLLLLAKTQLDAGDRKASRASLTAAEKAAKKGTSEAEEVEFARLRLDVVDGERALRAKMARAYLQRFPSGAHAIEAAEMYSLSSPGSADAERVLGAVVKALAAPVAIAAAGAVPTATSELQLPSATAKLPVSQLQMRRLCLACLRAGAVDAALLSAAPSEKERTPDGLLLVAEVRHQRGENGIAQSLADEARRKTQGRERAFIEENLARYRRGGTDPGDSLYLFDPLDPKPPAPTPAVSDPEQEARAARSSAFRLLVTHVSRQCGGLARGGTRRVWLRVALNERRVVERVLMLEPGVPMLLEACIASELVGKNFVHPLDGEDTFPITF